MRDAVHHSVLVCEDDPAMVRIFQFLLRQQGIRDVKTTANGEEVAPLARQHKPSVPYSSRLNAARQRWRGRVKRAEGQ